MTDTKTCTVCGCQKPVDSFLMRKNGKPLPRCKLCEAERIRTWKHANLERVREQGRLRAKTAYAANPEKFRALAAVCRQQIPPQERSRRAAESYAKNLERNRTSALVRRNANLETARENTRNWFRENRDKSRAYTLTRKATRLKATTSWEPELDSLVCVEASDKAVRLQALFGGEWHVDHIVPLQSKRVCGLHNAYNLRVLDALSNIQKGNRYWPDMP